MNSVAEECSRTMILLTDVLDKDTREVAPVELSKKRELFPELPLILWHSFDVCLVSALIAIASNLSRRYDFALGRDHFCLLAARPFTTLHCSFEPSLQCTRSAAMRCVP